MNNVLTIEEYHSQDIEKLSAGDIAYLNKDCFKHSTLAPYEVLELRDDKVKIKNTCYSGIIQLENQRIHFSTKVKANLFFMLSFLRNEEMFCYDPELPIEIKEGANFFDILDESKEDPVTVSAPIVEIYETSWCGYCKKAKNFFRSRGIKFKAYDVEKDKAAAHRMMALTRRRAVPFVVINGHQIQGYSEQAYTQALRN